MLTNFRLQDQAHKAILDHLLTFFCKLDHFINISNIYGTFTRRSSLQNRVRKFMPKTLYEIDPWSQVFYEYHSLIVGIAIYSGRGAQKLTGENLKLVCARFSTTS